MMKSFLCFVTICLFTTTLTAQLCGGSWALQRPLTAQCVSGQWVGWQDTNNPVGCPVNPVYVGTQTNTFTFSTPVSNFTIDFNVLDGTPFCPRIEIKINGIFYPLTTTNLTDFPVGSTCTNGSFNYVELTSDGYITISASGGPSLSGWGRIIISNVNATNVTVSTNDGFGTVFSNPFDCVEIVPLNLISFKGVELPPCKVRLNWQTGIELNVRNIEVQRSESGDFFEKISEVLPMGSNSSYYLEANNSSDGYFRLRINDIDGSYKYSEIIKIRSDCNKPIYAVTPNPTSSILEVTGLGSDESILIFDMLGRKVFPFNVLEVGNRFNIQSLAPGIYILQVTKDNIVKAQFKFIKR